MVAVDAASFAVSAALIALVRIPATPAWTKTAPIPSRDPAGQAPGGLLREWVAGLRAARDSQPLTVAVAVTALAQLAQGIFVVLFVVFVARELGGGGTEMGLLRGVQAIGGVLGGLTVGALGRRLPPRALIGYGFCGFGPISPVTWNGPAVTTALGVYVGLFIAVGIPGTAAMTGVLTLVHPGARALPRAGADHPDTGSSASRRPGCCRSSWPTASGSARC